MRAESLRASEVISLSEGSDFPLFASSRTMILGARSLSLLQTDLFDTLGPQKAVEMLARHGFEAGMSSATAMAGLYDWDSDEQWFRAGERLISMVGLAHMDIQHFKMDRQHKKLQLTGIWQDSLESAQWLRHHETSNDPFCHILAGFASGYASAVLGSEVLVREISCRAQGNAVCRFEGRPIEEWGLDLEKRRRRLTGMNMEEEVSRLRAQLQAVWDEMDRQRAKKDLMNRGCTAVDSDAEIIFRSEAMANVLALSEKAASTSSTILLAGESGTGKELIARFIHRRSGREKEPFMAVNCAALPPALLESELFGHVKGAFTGAERDKTGLFIEAGSGTIFLDEVGDLPLALQVKLLRAIQEREVRPVGGVRQIPVHARIISATNRNLEEMMDQGTFREDLYYRLAVIPVRLPALRDCREDIMPLARYFLEKCQPRHPGFTPRALKLMEAYPWPGNVRELENSVEYATVLSGGVRIYPEHLPAGVSENRGSPIDKLADDWPSEADLIKRYMHRVLEYTQGNQSRAARMLGIDYSTFWRRMKSWSIDDKKGFI